MNNKKKSNPVLYGLSIVLLASFLVSCAGGARQAAANWPEVSVDLENETAFLSAGSFVYGLNLATGVEKWHFPAEADAKISFYAAPVLIPDGQLIVAGYDHKLYGLDPLNGTEKWNFSEATNRYVASPLVEGSGIYAPNSDYLLYALDLTGKLRWTFASGQAQWSTPVSDGKTLFLPSMDHHMHALDIETGTQSWEGDDLGASVPGTAALSPEGILYVGTIASELLALNSQNGKVIWRVPAGDWVWGGPRLDGDRLYFADMDGSVFALDAGNGSVIWRIQPDTGDNRTIVGTPLVMGDVLYFGSASGTLYSVNKSDGSPRWNKTFEGKIQFGPVAAGDNILVTVTSRDLLLVSLDQNGNQIWTFNHPK
jgi:outer membrane protein assembly factor BamB